MTNFVPHFHIDRIVFLGTIQSDNRNVTMMMMMMIVIVIVVVVVDFGSLLWW